MTAFEIREELANRYNFEIRNVCCYHCEYWGYNRGKVLNSVGESKCMKRKNHQTGRTIWKHITANNLNVIVRTNKNVRIVLILYTKNTYIR